MLFQELAYIGFCELTLDRRSTVLKLVDDSGNKWDCTVIFYTSPYLYFKVGGGFSRMLLARRLKDGCHIMVGAPVVGSNGTLFQNCSLLGLLMQRILLYLALN
jgi:hypothetical protein